MINPSELNLDSLPWLPLEAKSAFPTQPAIYFAIDSQGNIQYIGRSANPKHRWNQHHQYRNLTEIGSIRIRYLFVDAPELLPELESALIEWFQPPLNRSGVKSKATKPALTEESQRVKRVMKVRRIRTLEIDIPNLGARIRQARLDANLSVQFVCDSLEISRTYWYRIENDKEEAIAEPLLRSLEQLLNTKFGADFNN